MSGNLIRTFTSKLIDPTQLRPEDINIRDIAHGLAGEGRFSNQTRRRYNVANHSVLVSWNVPEEYALDGLLHDAPEAYIRDMASPVKHRWFMWPYRWIDRKITREILERFDRPPKLPQAVHDADQLVYRAERWRLFDDSEPYLWPGFVKGIAESDISDWAPWSSEEAEVRFLERFAELTTNAWPRAEFGKWRTGELVTP